MRSRKRREPRGSGSSAQSNSTESANNTATTPAPQQPDYVVIERKEGGREVTIGGPYNEAMARSVLKLFRWAGAVARIEPAP
jgi:hypothetical protein